MGDKTANLTLLGRLSKTLISLTEHIPPTKSKSRVQNNCPSSTAVPTIDGADIAQKVQFKMAQEMGHSHLRIGVIFARANI
jgi:hypothetical protein